MDEIWAYITSLAKAQGPLAGALVWIAYLGREHMKADSAKHVDYENRMRLLEQDRVVKADIVALHGRIDGLGAQLADSQNTILTAIANRGPVK